MKILLGSSMRIARNPRHVKCFLAHNEFLKGIEPFLRSAPTARVLPHDDPRNEQGVKVRQTHFMHRARTVDRRLQARAGLRIKPADLQLVLAWRRSRVDLELVFITVDLAWGPARQRMPAWRLLFLLAQSGLLVRGLKVGPSRCTKLAAGRSTEPSACQ